MKKSTLKILASLAIVLCSFMPIMAQSDYGSDIVLKNLATENQRKPSLAIAGNGWLYAGFVTNTGTTYGYEVYKSTNDGQTWSNFLSYSSTTEVWYGVKLVVSGAAPYKVFIAKLRSYNTSGFFNLYISEYDGTTGTWTQNPFTYTTATTSPILDFDLVTDDLFPSNGSSPYGVGLLYSRRGAVTDSIKFVYSTNGGANFAAPKIVATSSAFYGKVSLAYGFSPLFNFGRYNAVWESKSSSGARTGRILYSRTSTGIVGDFITPVYIDTETSTNGKCCNPKIACQFNNTNNDSSNVTAVIVLERYFGDLDNDIIGYYNSRASSGNNTWNRYSIENSGSTNCKQPDINYDSQYNNFLVTYWDSTNTHLPYVLHGFNMSTNPDTWGVLIGNYNDNTTMGSLLEPYPVIEINNNLHMVAHLWSREGTSSNGVVMFDAEYVPVSIKETVKYGNDKISNLYPNPAFGATNLEIGLNKSALVQINVYDMAGKKISTIYNAQTNEGKTTITFDVSNFANGNYIIEMTTAESKLTSKMTVAHQ